MRIFTIALGDYPHTEPLKTAKLGSPDFTLDFQTVKPVNRAFAPMARERKFDISEMAIATVLQAIAHGVEITLLPVVMAARFQENALFVRADSPLKGPADLKGRRVGVRAYSQTTGLWLRGLLAHEYSVAPSDIAWTTFEGAHVAAKTCWACCARARLTPPSSAPMRRAIPICACCFPTPKPRARRSSPNTASFPSITWSSSNRNWRASRALWRCLLRPSPRR